MRVDDWECVRPEFLLTREQDPNRATSKTAPDETLQPKEPLCIGTKDQRTKCPAKSNTKEADPINLTVTHYLLPLSLVTESI